MIHSFLRHQESTRKFPRRRCPVLFQKASLVCSIRARMYVCQTVSSESESVVMKR
ncbi:unnamed protein product [Cyberlindnera jadinii]|uniref:Uncharacterized protein n=1 Tax=Cyberlindnera jadinii (strain ATCC 18201 / CBS 1600 / BCRC 20928 / JCM 3617 / NBRC 0987 / NRRL Y-1542) TaxID=983966 RepID=A0A0H5C993_CYBJN|nr:unnamed protein product [Cyberlindnera jadinii]